MNEEIKKDYGTWVVDIETISNFFSYVGINSQTDEQVTYIVWKGKNDLKELLEHLKNVKGQIGFNSLNFDYPVIHWIIKNAGRLKKIKDGEEVAREIYKIAQETIQKDWAMIRQPLIPQLDLFKIWHFDNFARSTS